MKYNGINTVNIVIKKITIFIEYLKKVLKYLDIVSNNPFVKNKTTLLRL